MTTFLDNLWYVYTASAPYLVLGLAIAGVLHQYVPAGLIKKFVSGGPIVSTVKAALIGTPVPLCSCGVVPVGLGLHRDGVGKSSTIAFLIATPENGVDSMSLSYSLFGGLFTFIRLVFALLVAVCCGLLVHVFDSAEQTGSSETADSCCHSGEKPATEPAKKLNGFSFVVNDFLPEIVLWILFGFGVSAVLSSVLPADILADLSGFTSLIVAAFIGLPLYVCASASTPIALSLFAAGLSPGACLVFLITGPATNAANIPLYAKEFGVKTTALFYASLLVTSIFFGWLVDVLFDRSDFSAAAYSVVHEHGLNVWELAGSVLFLPMICYAIWVKLKNH